MSKGAELPDGWLELGEEVLTFICKKLRIKRSHINAEHCAKELAVLVQQIGVAAQLSLTVQAATLETDKLMQRLGDSK